MFNYLKKSKVLSAILTLCIISFLLPSIAYSKEIPLKDVSSSDEAYSQIQQVLQQGWMSSTLDNFYPVKNITRAEFALILTKVNGSIKNLKNPSKSSFKDISIKDQYYNYIETTKGIIPYFKSKDGLYFKPKSFITREDALTSVVKLLGYDLQEASADGAASEISLKDLIEDSKSISPSLLKYASIAIQNELIDLQKIDGKEYLNPKKPITRKQLALLLINANDKKDYTKEDEIVDDNTVSSTTTSTSNQESTVSNLTLSIDKTEIEIGSSAKVTANITMNPSNAQKPAIEYNTSDKNIATVDSSGNIQSVSDGTVDISATVGNKTSTITLKISPKETVNPNSVGNLTGNLQNSGSLCEKNGWIYYMGRDTYCQEALYKQKIDGSERTKLNNDRPEYINVIGDWIYYTNAYDSNKIYKCKTDGSDKDVLHDGTCSLMTVVDDNIYYINQKDKKIYSVKTDGSNDHCLIPSGNNLKVDSFCVYGRWIYLCDDTAIYKLNIQTGESVKLITSSDVDSSFSKYGDFDSVIVEKDKLYFISEHHIYRSSLDGKKIMQISNIKCNSMIISDGWIYYFNKDNSDNSVYKCKIDGSQNNLLDSISHHDLRQSIQLTDSNIYFQINIEAWCYFYKCGLDGKNIIDIDQTTGQ